jgi:SagB-type dehydrogenase family enzyme
LSLNRETERLFAYHEATKHSYASVRAVRHTLDWANMPEPFRHYEDTPVVDLPADPPPPLTPALDVLLGAQPPADPKQSTGVFLSRLFFYSCSISATKLVRSTGYRYSLRVNPSSGNLHPTEFHFATRGLAGWEDGLYHYRPSAHMAELRATGDWTDRLTRSSAPLVLVLTSIAWREAWKYRSRAYRYCLLDAGHAWQSVALAARALGSRAEACGHFADQQVAEALGVSDEWPLLLIEIDHPASPLPGGPARWFGGRPNRLSEEQIEYPLIEAIHASSALDAGDPPVQPAAPAPSRPGPIALPAPVSASRPFGETVRQRRSALDFQGGDRTITFAQLATLLAAGFQPFHADFGEGLVCAYLYVHRVAGLDPGLYRHDAPSGTLELLRPGDQRLWAAALSLGQDLAANSCVTFSLAADLPRAAALHGNRGYRYAHFEAGAIGHRFYLAAEAMGLQSTGIGAFYDDDVHAYLGLRPGEGQVVYHFACGYAVPDDRLQPEE